MSEVKEKNYFEVLNSLNVSERVEKKNNLSYLSWAWAWGELKKIHPLAQYKVYEQEDGKIYWNDSRTAWVKVGVTVNGLEHIEYLPVMDFRNASITIDKITSFDVNKAIQRALTKAIARHGLGLYIYAGEDLPDGEEEENVLTMDTYISKGKTPATMFPSEIKVLKGYTPESIDRCYKTRLLAGIEAYRKMIGFNDDETKQKFMELTGVENVVDMNLVEIERVYDALKIKAKEMKK